MKKVLSLLMMAMLAIGAWAETVVFSEQGYNNAEEVSSYVGTDFTVTFDKGTNSNTPKYYTTGAAIRVYGGGFFTVASTTKTITKIELGFGSGDGTNEITTDVEAYENGTWTGSASSVTFTIGGTSGQRRIASIAVTFDDGTEPPVVTVTPPTFSPAAGEVVAGTAVTISAPDAELIIYTTDGTDPSYEENNGEIYTEPIVVNQAMTIKAIAVDADDNVSAVASAAYTIKADAVTCATVAEFNALEDGVEFTFTGNLVATGQTGKYLYAQDGENGILIFGTIDQTYSDLAEIPAGWTGKKDTYNGAPEAASPANFTAATEHVDLAPEEMTPAQVTLANAFKYAIIRGATVTMTNNSNGTITVGDETVALYKRFNITIPTDGGVYDIIGITGYYNAPQFMPLEFVPQGVTVAPPTFNPAAGEVEAGTEVTISAPDAELIIYTTDGTDPSYEGNNGEIYTEPIIVNEAMTIKAIAVDADDNVSAVASAAYTIKPGPITCATVTEILALEFNKEFTFTGNLIAIAQTGKYLYAQDEEGDGMYFFSTVPTYEKGDVIPGGWSGKYTEYKGSPEVTNITGMVESTETAELVAAEMTPAQVTVDPYNLYHYAVIKGASLGENGAIVAGEESVAGYYDRFGVYFPDDYEGKTYDVYGIPSWYNNAQFIPLEIVEVVETVESTITFEAPENGTIAVTLADGTEVESGVTKVAEGTKVTVAVTANTGYLISGFEVKKGDEVLPLDAEEDGAKDSNAETHTFTMPDGDVSINVTIEEDPSTAIDSINMENVKAVRYYNVAGVESATPFQGVNIVVREMTDGSKSVIKVVK